jgi:tetratricopeptide (TPR) repeat protein
MGRIAVRVGVGLLLALAVAVPARADQAADRAAALSALREGNRLLEGGRATEALARFQEAFRLTSSPKLFYNIGQAHRDLPGHEVEAYESFNRYLDQAQDANPQTRAEAERMRSELHRKLAFLTVATRPAGAQISIDGSPRGAAPLSLALPPGTHTLRVQLAKHVAPGDETLVLAAGQTVARNLELQPAAAPALAVTPPPAANRPQLPQPLPQVSPEALAAGSAGSPKPSGTLTTVAAQGQDRGEEDRPLYQRWWVWAAAGAVAAGVVAALLISGGSDSVTRQCPNTTSGICAPLPPRN